MTTTSSTRAPRKTLHSTDWESVEAARDEFRFLIGNSVLEQFVRSHEDSDVLRELVQNEYDAEGTRLEVTFGEHAITITGNGNPIDAAGWKRLSVVLA